jgi:hypothetical protein
VPAVLTLGKVLEALARHVLRRRAQGRLSTLVFAGVGFMWLRRHSGCAGKTVTVAVTTALIFRGVTTIRQRKKSKKLVLTEYTPPRSSVGRRA